MTTLTTTELAQLSAMRTQARADSLVGIKSYYKIYETLAGWLTNEYGVSATDSAVLWLRGATEANADRGAMATLIRSYTDTQYRLRYGAPMPAGKMQEASNLITERLLKDLLGENEPEWPKGKVPDIARIAEADATAVRDTLFGPTLGHPEADTAFSQNSAWSGALLFTLLRSDQSSRLTSTGSAASIDTLNDWRDVLYAFKAFDAGFDAAKSAALSQPLVDGVIFGTTVWGYIAGPGTFSDAIDAGWYGTDNPTLKAAFKVIADVGQNRFLDMLTGAAKGKNLLGQTTDANFATSARTFFDSYGAALQSTAAKLLPTDATAIANLARTDVNTRAALLAGSFIQVQVSETVASSAELSLYNPSTGQGQLTDSWLTDRALFVLTFGTGKSDSYGQQWRSNSLPIDRVFEFRYIDGNGAEQIILAENTARPGGVTNVVPTQRIYFGSDGADTVTGSDSTKLGDRLYGGAGNDTLNGFKGDDYLEGGSGDDTLQGGADKDTLLGGQGDDTLDGGDGDDRLLGGDGTDTYKITAGEGLDTIVDKDGVINFKLNGQDLTLNGGAAVPNTPNTWVGQGGKVFYVLIPSSTGTGQDLIVTSGDGAFKIEGFQPGDMGINLTGAVADTTVRTTPAPGSAFDHVGAEIFTVTAPYNWFNFEQRGDRDKVVVADGVIGVVHPFYGRGSAVDAGEIVIGGTGNDFLATGLEGWATSTNGTYRGDFTQDAGADYLEGNGGTDVLVGGNWNDIINGGAEGDWLFGGRGADILDGGIGDDLLFASHSVFDNYITGFAALQSWETALAESAYGGAFNWRSVAIAGGSGSLSYRLEGLSVVDTTNRINEALTFGPMSDYVDTDAPLYGPGGDNLRGGLGNDVLIGSHATDYLFGDADADKLYGRGGIDYLYGGDGNDVIFGGGSSVSSDWAWTGVGMDLSDYIEGGQGNDSLFGDDGDDTIYGGIGNDVIFGGADGDWLYGDEGNDQISGEAGNDHIFGGAGVDTIYGDAGTNDIYAGEGDDFAFGGKDQDTIHGGTGTDTLRGGSGVNQLLGDDGDDILIGEGNAFDGISKNTLDGGAGNDTLSVNATYSQDNVFVGGTGNDVMTGSSSQDSYLFNLGDGKDTVTDLGSATTVFTDKLIFGPTISPGDIKFFRQGNDMVFQHINGADQVIVKYWFFFSPTQNSGYQLETVEFADGTIWTEANLTAAALIVEGTDSNDVMTGTDRNDTLRGGAGNDVIRGGYGDNILDGGDGNDEIIGEGDQFSSANGPVTRWSSNTLIGGAGDDTLRVEVQYSRDNVFIGGAGNDLMYGSLNADTYIFNLGDGVDTVGMAWDGSPENIDHLVFGSGITESNITAIRVDTSLILQLENGNDRITFGGWFNFANLPLQTITFGDGHVWNSQRISELTQSLLTVFGTSGDDSFIDSRHDETIFGLDGNDRIDGRGGNNRFDGGAGDDVISADGNGNTEWRNTLIGGDGNDTLSVETYLTYGTIFEGGRGNDTIVGSANNDTYVFNLGDGQDTITDGQGFDPVGYTDTLKFGVGIVPEDIDVSISGNDIVFRHINGSDMVTIKKWFDFPDYRIELVTFLDGTSWTIDQILDNALSTTGTSGNDTLLGSVFNDALYGLAGNDSLDGRGGADAMYGGEGNDTYTVDNTGDAVSEAVNQGMDTVRSSITWTLGSNFENLTLTGSGAINGVGNAADNVLTGNSGNNNLSGDAGNDRLDGGTGTDTMAGGIGDDTYVVNVSTDVVIENVNEGIDLVQAGATYTLSANVENLTLTGTSAINGTGNALNNVLTGNNGANVLTGGAGNDTYVVGTGDSTVEVAGGGTDSVQSSVTWTLGTEVESLTLTGTSAVNGTGNALNNLIVGNSAANTLSGGAGADTMMGGAGNDTYVVDNSADIVTENAAEGTDLVQSSVIYALASNVENLTLTGTSAINGTGNSANNTLTGNTGNNILDGAAGADTMIGGTGNDTYYVDNVSDVTTEAASAGTDTVIASLNWTLATNLENLTLSGTATINATGNAVANVLTGNAGNNVLNGGAGADTMVGGAGDDTYVVDSTTDVVTEGVGAGTDLVQSSVTYTLATNVENITLTGTTAINATGNALDNILTGNSGNNVLTGGAGNDTYVVTTGDTTTEAANAGTDTVRSAVTWTLAANLENLTLTGTAAVNGIGNTADNLLLGNTGANVLTGNAGNDTLNGGAGADSLVGGVGNDTYWLGRGYGVDTITENDATSGNTDVARFDTGIATNQLWFTKVGNNLDVSIIGTSDKFTLANWYLGNQYHVEQFKTSDGKTLLDSQVQNLVSAMAAFAPPAAGQTTLAANYASTLNPVIAANWQ